MGLGLDTVLPVKTKSRKKFKTVGELEKDDLVYDLNGKTCKITHVDEPKLRQEGYRILFSNGEKIQCDEDQLWRFKNVDDTLSTIGVAASSAMKRGFLISKDDELIKMLQLVPLSGVMTRRITVDSADRTLQICRQRLVTIA